MVMLNQIFNLPLNLSYTWSLNLIVRYSSVFLHDVDCILEARTCICFLNIFYHVYYMWNILQNDATGGVADDISSVWYVSCFPVAKNIWDDRIITLIRDSRIAVEKRRPRKHRRALVLKCRVGHLPHCCIFSG